MSQKAQANNGIMEDWNVGRMGKDGRQQKKGRREKQKNGRMEYWNNGRMEKPEQPNNGRME